MNRTGTPEAAALDQRLSVVWTALESLTDPEIPVLSLREMGILREVRSLPAAREMHLASDMPPVGGEEPDIEVVITPTYSGCPAMGQIEDDVRRRLAELGIRARLVVQMAPAWTTDWMSAAAHSKLRAYGIAPPNGRAPVAQATIWPSDEATGATGSDANPTQRSKSITLARKAARSLAEPSLPCPRCGSPDTTETSHFGSTACKALYRCLACMEPFDFFKPH